ncbi:phosphatidylglycerol lysyltransferase domain-containing protein [Streptomyces sp. AS58]|uniref:phosphatidylglycerol lysyltransferase domain-containing protein n=1 Tax=Streptomyces sp. AS58 TaxID=1519489 RepID=UPI00099B4417|nr:phosphatidylglycerol lysyltransferase domain-containing protein [Streptomyces sp. AS58]
MSVKEEGERTPRPLRVPRPEAVPVLIAGACALSGLLNIATGVLPRFGHLRVRALAEVLPGALGPFAAALPLGTGVLLLLLAPALRRGERRARRAAVALLPVGAVAQFAYGPFLVGVVVPLALLAPLLRHRDRFTVLPEPSGRWRALANFVLMGAGSLTLGLIVVGARSRAVIGDPSLADRITHVLLGLFGFDGPVRYRGDTSWNVAVSLGTLGLITALTTARLALRPARPAARLTRDDEARLRALLDRHGAARDPLGRFTRLGRFTPRRGRAVVFSPSGRAAVIYRVVSGVMLADGDPLGDVDAWPGAIERFMDEARARQWTPAVTGCSEQGGRVWTRETGLDVLGPGDEVVTDADFSLPGRALRAVRRAVRGALSRTVGSTVGRVAGRPVRRTWGSAERRTVGSALRRALGRIGCVAYTNCSDCSDCSDSVGHGDCAIRVPHAREPRKSGPGLIRRSADRPVSGDRPRTGFAALRAEGLLRLGRAFPRPTIHHPAAAPCPRAPARAGRDMRAV